MRSLWWATATPLPNALLSPGTALWTPLSEARCLLPLGLSQVSTVCPQLFALNCLPSTTKAGSYGAQLSPECFRAALLWMTP